MPPTKTVKCRLQASRRNSGATQARGAVAGAARARRRGLDGHPPAAPAPPSPPSPRSALRGRPGSGGQDDRRGAAALRFACIVFAGEVPLMTGPGDEIAAGTAGRGRLRASRAEREQAIEVLKAAFVQGRAGQGRVRCAGGSRARVADLRGAGRGHRRHSRRADRSPAAGQTRPGTGPAAGEHGGQGGCPPDHCDNRVYGRLVGGRVVRQRR